MLKGVDGLLQDKTRPSRKPALPQDTIARVVELTQGPPPGETTHWTSAAMAEAAGISRSSVLCASGAAMVSSLTVYASSSSPKTHSLSRSFGILSGFIWRRPPMRLSGPWTKKARSRHSTALSRGCR